MAAAERPHRLYTGEWNHMDTPSRLPSARLNLMPAERHAYICNLARQHRIVRVSVLSEALGVSEITIRRDLEKLEEQGLLERTHGGAVLNQHMQAEPLYAQKDRLLPEAKAAIGRAAAELVEEGETVFVNSGSTTRQIFGSLRKPAVRVVTSNAAALAELASSEPIDLIIAGGAYRWQSNSFVGPLALATISRIYARRTFLGVDGISARYGITTPILEESEVARAMVEQTCGPVVVVADHTKIGVIADFVICPLNRVDIIITDAGFDEEYRASLEEKGARIIIAAEDAGSANP